MVCPTYCGTVLVSQEIWTLGNLEAAVKQQMQQVLGTEHQMQAMAAEQHMQAMAAEQQRQMQMAQMASMQSPYMSPQQTAFGMSPMSPMYSPYPNTVGYF